jgi:hypothetical protein
MVGGALIGYHVLVLGLVATVMPSLVAAAAGELERYLPMHKTLLK